MTEKVGHCVSTFQMSKPTAVIPTPVLLGTKVANDDLMMAKPKTEAHSSPAIQYNNPPPLISHSWSPMFFLTPGKISPSKLAIVLDYLAKSLHLWFVFFLKGPAFFLFF